MRTDWIGLFFLSLALCIPVACQPTEEATRESGPNLQTVERGMSPSDVRAIMGPPRQTVRENGDVQWMVYGTPAHQVMIYFRDERVVALPRSGAAPVYSGVP